MGLMSFIKEAGEKLFGGADAKAAPAAAASAPAPTPTAEDVARLNRGAADAIAAYIGKLGLKVEALQVDYDGASQTVTVAGQAADQATKEKVVLSAGNVQHVAAVNDKLTVAQAAPESQIHVVEKGDTLSAIAKRYYGNAGKYQQIFEANKPMLSDPDKIYPGQALRIPPQA